MKNKKESEQLIKGYKITDSNMQCRGKQYEIGKRFTETGIISICDHGIHFCEKVNHCFNYYDFSRNNRVFEIAAYGSVITQQDKSCCLDIEFIKELTWEEILKLANLGIDNTGHSNSGNWNSGESNSGNRNSGNRNSGNRNSGNRNSGERNSGDRNSGDRNSGDSNSGYRNSGDWNSGDRNSGESNSGYRNSGAFCTDNDPKLYLFNKATKMTVKEWEKHKAVQLMYSIDFTLWIPDSVMTDEEKKAHPKYETTEGYLKTIPTKEAWANFWGNLMDENKKVFLTLPNFDWAIFTEITGIEK